MFKINDTVVGPNGRDGKTTGRILDIQDRIFKGVPFQKLRIRRADGAVTIWLSTEVRILQ